MLFVVVVVVAVVAVAAVVGGDRVGALAGDTGRDVESGPCCTLMRW